MAKLFPLLPFIDDETPLSWASRQAAFHTGGRLVPFLNDMGIPLIDLARGKHDAVARLCDITGQDPAPVFNNTIMAVGDRRFSLRNIEFSAEFTTGVTTRFCPKCLADDMMDQRRPMAMVRHRLEWRLLTVRTCKMHGVPLQDICRGKWDDFAHELQNMMPQVNRAIASTCSAGPRSVSTLQSYVLDRLEGKNGPEWLDNQDIDQVTRASEMLGGVVTFGATQTASKMTEETWNVAGENGFNILSKGPDAVDNALLRLIMAGGTETSIARPHSTFGMLYSWLAASRISKDPGPIYHLLREQILNNMAVTKGQVLLGMCVTEPKFSTVSNVAKNAKIHPSTLSNILRAAGLLAEGKGTSYAERTVVKCADAKPIIELAKRAVPVSMLPQLLHASRPLVQSLIDLGQLTRIQDHAILKSKLGKAVDSHGLKAISRFIKTQFKKTTDAPDGYVDLAKASELCRAKQCVILELLFGGHLEKGFRLESKRGFESLLVSVENVKAVLALPPDGVSTAVKYHEAFYTSRYVSDVEATP